MTDRVDDLLRFIDDSPTPYHAVETAIQRLEAAGFSALDEAESWSLAAGDRRYVTRAGASLLAFEVGTQMPSAAGFRVVGAHTDSPNLRIKPEADVRACGYHQLAVEPYGGVLLHTWLDRDLSLAGRVTLRVAGEGGSGTGSGAGEHSVTRLVDFERPLLRVPNLAIHLYREIATDGLKLNPQQHMKPLVALDRGEASATFADLLCEELGRVGAPASPEDILGFDLMAYDVQPSARSGAKGEFIHAARLDNLASSHAGLVALEQAAEAGPAPVTRVVVLYDHEEVGSRSAQGAAGPLLADGLARIVSSLEGEDAQAMPRAVARSWLVSADMAHAIHPNYADRHEPGHRPVLGGGPVIKTNVNQAYATDSETAALFTRLCRRKGIEPQNFVARSDLGCGSTIGPISAARVGIRTVDVGNPMLSMHSIREMAASADVEPMIDVLGEFFRGD